MYLTTFCFILLLQKEFPARIIPDTYPESYPNLVLLCHGAVRPLKKRPQSPAWCRRKPLDIGYNLYKNNKKNKDKYNTNYISKIYLEICLRIIFPI